MAQLLASIAAAAKGFKPNEAGANHGSIFLNFRNRTNTTADWRVTPVRSGGMAPAVGGGPKVHAVLVGDTLDKDIGPLRAE